jgi:DNA-binding response OmpR family regulator
MTLETLPRISWHLLVVGQNASLTSGLIELLRTENISAISAYDWSAMEDTLRQIKMDLVVIPLELLHANAGSVRRSVLSKTKSRLALVADGDAPLSERFERYLDVVGRVRRRSAAEMAAHISSLLAGIRVKELTRRTGHVRFRDWLLDPLSRSCSRSDGWVVYLDDDEFELLQLLCEHCGTVLSRGRIARALYRNDSASSLKRLDRTAALLRSKIEDGAPEHIREVGDFGLVLSAENHDNA